MLHREVSNGSPEHACPVCGKSLAQDGTLLLCMEHGAFFAYGPHLLVRAPEQRTRNKDVPLPWESANKGKH